MIRIFAISGSIRRASSNTSLLAATSQLLPEGVALILYKDLANLPHFNPDLEGNEPLAVLDFRKELRAAHGVMIASPEYAHGVTGVIKNALDWVVGSGEFVAKPVALLNASPRAIHAQASLTEILKTMDAHIIPEASLTIPLSTNKLDEAAIMAQPEYCRILKTSLMALLAVIRR